jgi:hypothetical protein
MRGYVETALGPMPGCAECGIIKLWGGPHLCEHGVTPVPPPIVRSFTLDLDAEQVEAWFGDLYR